MTDFLTIKSNDLTAQISPWGAALARLWMSDHDTSLVLGLPCAQDYANAPDYSGVVVGPIAGRVSGAQTTIDGKQWKMHANTPPDCLHSGADGLSSRKWSVQDHTSDTLTLSVDLAHGDCGLPGNRTLSVTYTVTDATLNVEITSTTDADSPMNATLHAYWALDDTGSLSNHELRVASSKMCETTPALIPTGTVVDHAGQDHDFTVWKSPVAGAPLDGCFCLEPSDSMRDVMDLQSLHSGIALTVATDQPGLVLYTGEFLTPSDPPVNAPQSAPFSALAIEAQGWPNATNLSEFPQILVKKGTVKRQKTQFSLRRT